jgi:hypothetical protein
MPTGRRCQALTVQQSRQFLLNFFRRHRSDNHPAFIAYDVGVAAPANHNQAAAAPGIWISEFVRHDGSPFTQGARTAYRQQLPSYRSFGYRRLISCQA